LGICGGVDDPTFGIGRVDRFSFVRLNGNAVNFCLDALLGDANMSQSDLGWTDHVGRLDRMRTAVRILAESRGKTADRMEKATYALCTIRPEDFPMGLRNRAEKVLSLRGNVARAIGDYTYFAFNELKPSERARFVKDLLSLYEGCLIDIGRTWPMWDFVYPTDVGSS
jgi:hypothetical protein